MCEVFDICRSAYYQWAAGGKRSEAREREDAELKMKMKKIHTDSRKTYGTPRMVMALQTAGHACGKHRVSRLMHEEGIVGEQKKRFNPYTTNSDHGLAVAPNLMGSYGVVTGPNQVWAGDITYIRINDGWVYLAAILDMYSRKIVGWDMSENIDGALVVRALERATQARPAPFLYHSDRGSQYASHDYQATLKFYGIKPSMSRSGNPYDNATMESFFGTLKFEEVRGQTYTNAAEARAAIFSYIEAFYNTTRIHTSIGGMTPQSIEKFFSGEEKTSTVIATEEQRLKN